MIASRHDQDAARVAGMGIELLRPLARNLLVAAGVKEDERLWRHPGDRVAEVVLAEPGIERGDFEMRVDAESFDAWLGEHDLRDAVAATAGKPLLLLHAQGDERVPYTFSEELYSRAGEPRKLILLPGGHHRSIQHDAELWGVALGWIGRELGI